MKKQKRIYIPYSIKDLNVRVVLFEKYQKSLVGLSFCCWLNDVPIYTDSTMGKNKVLTGSSADKHEITHKTFLIVGIEPEVVKTDSTILQSLCVLIKEVYVEKIKSVDIKI